MEAAMHLLPDSVELRTRLLARTPSSGCSCTYCLLRLSQWNLRDPVAMPSYKRRHTVSWLSPSAS